MISASGHAIEACSQHVLSTHICIRPEQVRVAADAPIVGRILSCTYQGERFRLALSVAGETVIAHVPKRPAIGEELRPIIQSRRAVGNSLLRWIDIADWLPMAPSATLPDVSSTRMAPDHLVKIFIDFAK